MDTNSEKARIPVFSEIVIRLTKLDTLSSIDALLIFPTHPTRNNGNKAFGNPVFMKDILLYLEHMQSQSSASSKHVKKLDKIR